VGGKLWALFFMLTALAALAATFAGPLLGVGFPGDGRAYTTIGVKIDSLFMLILWIVVVVFIGTQLALGYVLWKGAEAATTGRPAQFSHGNPTLEVIWTIIPAAILLFLAIYQMDVWAEYRIKTMIPKANEVVAEVTARQFEWRIRYPQAGKPLGLRPQPDDVHTVNDLRVPVGRSVSINLRTEDVQHSFFVPHLRIKQDAVPGKVIPVWFHVTKAGEYDLVCAELCGWGHYKMKARVLAMPEDEFQAWKKQIAVEQFTDGVTAAAPDSNQTPNTAE